jgi:hypothetical protein
MERYVTGGGLKASFSNCDIRAYQNKHGRVVLHCQTVLFIDCGGWNFPSEYFSRIHFSLILSNGEELKFEVQMHCDSEFAFNGINNTYTFKLKVTTDYHEVDDQVVSICLSTDIDFPHGPSLVKHKQLGVIRNTCN